MAQNKNKTPKALKFSSFKEAQDFFGPPPILSTENPQDYLALGQAIWKARRPKDFIEVTWVNDITYQLWEVLRLRRVKPQLIDDGRFQALKKLIEERAGSPYGDSFWRKWQEGDEESNARVDHEFQRAGLNAGSITAKAHELLINILENLERQCSQLEARRLVTIRESVQYRANIEARREGKARRTRLGVRANDPLLLEGDEKSQEIVEGKASPKVSA